MISSLFDDNMHLIDTIGKKQASSEGHSQACKTFPRDRKIAFHPSNCLTKNAEDNYDDNLFKMHLQFPSVTRNKNSPQEVLETQEYVIFATTTMLYQMTQSKQYFIDGTFAISPTGFHKSERSYSYALDGLLSLAKQHNFSFQPSIIMVDFETGLRNAIKSCFNVTEEPKSAKIVGCYFHYVKALIKRAKSLRLITKRTYDDKTKLLIGLLKLLVHCPKEKRSDFYEQINKIYEKQGDKYKDFLAYYKKNWFNNGFLDDLFTAFAQDHDIKFIRTNNACELFNHYLGLTFEYKKPRPGYFIEKIKEIEYMFRGDYLARCQGKNRKELNIRKNPLENTSLPYEQIFEICFQKLKQESYNLRDLKKRDEFIKNIQELASKFIDEIEFIKHPTQNDDIKLFNQEAIEPNEEEGNKIENEKENESEKFEEEEEKSDYILEEVSSPGKRKVVTSKKRQTHIFEEEKTLQVKSTEITTIEAIDKIDSNEKIRAGLNSGPSNQSLSAENSKSKSLRFNNKIRSLFRKLHNDDI